MIMYELNDSWIESMPETYQMGDLIPLTYCIQLKDDNGEYLNKIRNVFIHAFTINDGNIIHFCRIDENSELIHQTMELKEFRSFMIGYDYMILNLNDYDESYEVSSYTSPKKMYRKKPEVPESSFSLKKDIDKIDIKLKDDADLSMINIKGYKGYDFIKASIEDSAFNIVDLLVSFYVVTNPRTLFLIHELNVIINSLPDKNVYTNHPNVSLDSNFNVNKHLGYGLCNREELAIIDIRIVTGKLENVPLWKYPMSNYLMYDGLHSSLFDISGHNVHDHELCNIYIEREKSFDSIYDNLEYYCRGLQNNAYCDNFTGMYSVCKYIDMITDCILIAEECLKRRMSDGTYDLSNSYEITNAINVIEVEYNDGSKWSMKYANCMEYITDRISIYAEKSNHIKTICNDNISKIPYDLDSTITKEIGEDE